MKGLLITPYHRRFGGVEVMNQQLHQTLAHIGVGLDQLAAEDYVGETPSWKLKLFGLPAASAEGFKRVAKRYDFIICNGEFAWGINHPNVLVLFHGSYFGLGKALKNKLNFKYRLSYFWQSLIQRMAANNHFVVTVSNWNKNILREQGINVDLVIENPVNLQTFQMENIEGNGRCLFVGSYQHYAKGFDHLENLAERGISIDCVTNQIPSSSLGYLGELSKEQLPQIYGQYDLLIHPSRFESSCLVALEAMASGIPVLIHDVGIAYDLKNEIPQFVIDFEKATTAEILERIELLKKMRPDYGKRAREYVEKYHGEQTYLSKWRDLFSKWPGVTQ